MTVAARRPLAPSLCLALLLVACVATDAAAQSGPELMQKSRQLHRVKDEEEHLLLRLIGKSGAVKERRVARWTLTSGNDLDKILVRFLAPRDVENTALLTWEAPDGHDDQWLYLPAAKKPKRIAASGKKNRFMGTDFTFEDMRPENTAVNTYTLSGSEAIDGQDCWVIQSVPGNERQAADTAYGKRRLWLRKDSLALVKREYYDKQGRLEKIETMRRLANVKGTAWRSGEYEMHDVQNGTKTLVVIEKRAVEKGLRDDFFSEAELTRGGS